MFIHSLVPLLLCFSAQLVSVSSSPVVVERAASTCSANDIAIVKRTAPADPVYFCQWWQQDVRTRSPFMEFTPTQVDTLCKCISPIATTGPKCKRKLRRSEIEERAADPNAGRSASSCSAEVSVQFTEPWRFCTFYTAYPRTTSPFKKYTASALTSLCKCAITKPSTTTSKKVTTTSASKKVSTTSKKTSTTSVKPITTSKKTSTTSTKKTSTSTKPATVQKPATTSSKKPTTTSTKKPTTTSTKKPTSTSTKKVTSTSTKKSTITSTTKKPSTTSSRKTTSSTKRATTTSSKR
ncbi:uncharacterized protein M437DRAFT_84017 [Aureobasidium melanogenum CBS 110374]|uniref:Uncharacterized protein n=1 Tax=Aureobasidium melanogenum (strain CBS 110374) TaxID=1043003 RepID=A0A074VSC9_AURM1|nr:uncharacterized protein M437DRAFT_84017 [Aureobasidium melanogenum CBS 110374]KEQ63650.1 hypothetical protein M437DRAFT_84017 [Aureobasidium melanogenum CBS 110374]